MGEIMIKPTWVKVVGILGIIFGCTGILGSFQLMVLPRIFAFQRKLLGVAMDQARNDPEFPRELEEVLTSMWNLPDWFGIWAAVFGVVGLLVAAFYLFAAIQLLQVKTSADKLMIGALLISLLLAIVQALTIITSGSFMAIMFVAGTGFSLVIDLVLLIVILTSDRSIFKPGANVPTPTQPAP
jgi:hypothetical protein